MGTTTNGGLPVPLRNGLFGAAIGLAVAVLGRLAFGEIISGRDLVAGPLGTGAMLAGTAWLHLTATGGERGRRGGRRRPR